MKIICFLAMLALVGCSNMATTPFTLVGNSADSRGLAQCRATVCCTLPNDHAQQPGPLGELYIPESEHAAPVGCSVRRCENPLI